MAPNTGLDCATFSEMPRNTPCAFLRCVIPAQTPTPLHLVQILVDADGKQVVERLFDALILLCLVRRRRTVVRVSALAIRLRLRLARIATLGDEGCETASLLELGQTALPFLLGRAGCDVTREMNPPEELTGSLLFAATSACIDDASNSPRSYLASS